MRISEPAVCSKPEVSSMQDNSEPSARENLKSSPIKSIDFVPPAKSVLSTIELPCHLGDLFKRSTNNLTNEEYKQLHDLLLEFAHNIMFSEGPRDPG